MSADDAASTNAIPDTKRAELLHLVAAGGHLTVSSARAVLTTYGPANALLSQPGETGSGPRPDLPVYVVSAEGKFPAVRMPKSRPGVPDSVFGSAFFVVATDNADVISWGLGDAPVDLAPLGPVVDLVPARS